MARVLKRNRSDNSIAFAHCISGDFGHERRMTAGVAVEFKKEFGKPTTFDCINDHLTYQEVEDGAGIYGLITKLNYNGKPVKKDYDEAFKQLTISFQNKKFKRLICSPLGCVRDQVPLEHFISKIVQFQQETGADVEIVIHKQFPAGNVYNGLSYEQFKLTMKKLLSTQMVSSECPTPKHTPAIQPIAESPMTPSSPWKGWSPIPNKPAEDSTFLPLTPRITPGHLQYSEAVMQKKTNSDSDLGSGNQKQSNVLSGCSTSSNVKESGLNTDSLKCVDKSFLE